jgi:hypothetical protein
VHELARSILGETESSGRVAPLLTERLPATAAAASVAMEAPLSTGGER